MRPVLVGSASFGSNSLVLISGPCVVEDPETMRRAAGELSEICAAAGASLVFKSSYEKDNRTDAGAHRGPGLEAGLELLAGLKRELGLALCTDVHRVEDVRAAAEVVDLVQVPALLCRQTSLLEAVGACGRPVNLKKGQFASARVMAGAVDKVRGAGGRSVLITERGSSFGDRLVCDLPGVAALRALGCPVVIDAGHAANAPAEIPLLARAGVAVGADAVFIEAHPDPVRARCDGGRMLSLGELSRLLPSLVRLFAVAREQWGDAG